MLIQASIQQSIAAMKAQGEDRRPRHAGHYWVAQDWYGAASSPSAPTFVLNHAPVAGASARCRSKKAGWPGSRSGKTRAHSRGTEPGPLRKVGTGEGGHGPGPLRKVGTGEGGH